MASTVGCTLNMYQTNPTLINPSSEAIGTIKIHLRRRYLLQQRSIIDGGVTVIEDTLSPKFYALFKIPLCVLDERELHELHLSKLLSSLKVLDRTVCNYLAPRIAPFAEAVAEWNGMKGFDMVAEVEVTAIEVVDGGDIN